MKTRRLGTKIALGKIGLCFGNTKFIQDPHKYAQLSFDKAEKNQQPFVSQAKSEPQTNLIPLTKIN